MALWDPIFKALGYIKADALTQQITGGEVPFGYAGDYDRHNTNITWNEEQLKRWAIQSAWVFSDVNLLAQNVPTTLQVVKKQGEKEIALNNHPFEQLIEMPAGSEYIDSYFLWTYSLIVGLMYGEFFWLLTPDKGGELREIMPIPTERCWPVPDAKNYIGGFKYRPVSGGNVIDIPRERVFYWRRPGQYYHRGMGLFEPLNRPLEADISASQWNVDTFRKGLSLQSVLSLPETLSNPLFEQAKADIRRAIHEEKQRFIIARGGQLKAEAVGMTHRDAEYMALRDMTRKEIDRIFGIPEGYWSEKATRANADAAHIGLYKHAIAPLRRSIESAITAQILGRFYGQDLRARFENDVAPDPATWEAKSLDEVRTDLGLPPWHTKEQGKTLFPLAKQGKWEGQQEQSGQPGGGASPTGKPEGGPPPPPDSDSGKDPMGKAEARQQSKPQQTPTAPPPEPKEPKEPEAKGWVKHLQGKHDQKTHGKGGGSASSYVAGKIGGSVTENEDMYDPEVLGRHLTFKTNGVEVQTYIREAPNEVFLNSIKSQKRGASAGTSIVNALKEYSDATGKKLIIPDATKDAVPYWDRQKFLKKDTDVWIDFDGEKYNPPNTYSYTPGASSKAYTLIDQDTELIISEALEITGEARDDLKRWRSIARRQAKRGKSPHYHFETKHIPEAIYADIMVGLEGVRDEEGVRDVFDNALSATKAVTFVPRGSADPLPPTPQGLVVGDPDRPEESEAAMDIGAALFDELMPEFAGLVDAEGQRVPVVKAYTLVDVEEEVKGGPGSGNWGHAGRKGKRGGSAPRNVAMSRTTGKDAKIRQQAARVGAGLAPVSKPSAKAVEEAKAAIAEAQGELQRELKKIGKEGAILDRHYERMTKASREFFEYKNGEHKEIRELEKKRFELLHRLTAARQDGHDTREIEKQLSEIDVEKIRRGNGKFYKLQDRHVNAQNRWVKKSKAVEELTERTQAMHDSLIPHRETLMAHNIHEARAVRKNLEGFSEKMQTLNKERDVASKAREDHWDAAVKPIFERKQKEVKNADALQQSYLETGDEETFKKYKAKLREINQINAELGKTIDAHEKEYSSKANALGDEIVELNKQMGKVAKVDNKASVKAVIDDSGVEGSIYKFPGEVWESGVDSFNEFVGVKSLDNVEISMKSERHDSRSPGLASGRSYYRQGEKFATGTIFMDDYPSKSTVVHELGHALEMHDPFVGKKAQEFLARRTRGENPQKLSDLTGSDSYSSSEVAKPDKFKHPYMGKIYGNDSSEIISMGLEEMYRSPAKFAQEDPDYFDFIYALMRTGV